MIELEITENSPFRELYTKVNECIASCADSSLSKYKLVFSDNVQLIDKEQTSSFLINLLNPKELFRVTKLNKNKEALLKAIAHKGKIEGLCIADATAGLGRDSLLMQSAKAQVFMYERNIIVYALLYAAIEQAKKDEHFDMLLNGLPTLMPFGSLKEHNPKRNFDVIYYDPMFPNRSKSSLVKKNMQVFHDVVGFDQDLIENLDYFLTKVNIKVVVKRPKNEAPLTADNLKVAYSVDGGACRFDCYLPK